MNTTTFPDTDAALQQATAAHKAGRLDQAEMLYRGLLRTNPDNAPASHNLGVMLAQRGQLAEALPLLQAAVRAAPGNGFFAVSCARALLALGHAQEALVMIEMAVLRGARGPGIDSLLSQARTLAQDDNVDVDALYARAVEHHKARRPLEAEALYRRVLTARPEQMNAWDNLGNMLGAQGRFDEAIAVYRKALEVQPDNAEMFDNLGYALVFTGKIDEAIAAYREAVRLKPDFDDAKLHLASALSENGHVAEGFALFMRRAEEVYSDGKGPRNEEPQAAHKIKHDREQRDYLAGGQAPADAPQIDDMFHVEDGSRIDGPAVNPANYTPEMLEKWRTSWPQLVVMEDFLTPEALEKLRRYCAGSTVWRRIYSAGYLGARPKDGFACPLLAQIVEEIQSTFPAIMAPHKFQYLGAFKYDSELSTGTNTHADNSAVNVNFYIAPDDANLDPQTGGMDIWDVTTPPDEDMFKYNNNETLTVDYLKRNNAKKIVIPHRANRAVFFRSDTIHKTSECTFKEGYLNKRINVSLLYGRCGDPTK